MNQSLQKISDFVEQTGNLSAEEKVFLAKAVKDTDSALTITEFKLERTEKVKRTTAILLEETIEELEQKRKAVEAQNRDLEIESSLERVRTVAMGMRTHDDLLGICEILFTELHSMGFDELRNAMINLHDDEKGSFLNYDYSKSAGATVTTIMNNSHTVTENFVKEIRKADDAFVEFSIRGSRLDEWREYRKSMGEQDDPKLTNTLQLSYYFYSIGTGSIGISTYSPVTEELRTVLKRFRNVFNLAYRRYIDITKAEAQAIEAQIEAALERVRSRSMGMQKSEELKEVIQVVYEQFVHLNILIEHTGFIMDYRERDDMHIWLADQHKVPSQITIPYFDSPHWNSYIKAKEKGLDFFVNLLSFEEKNRFYQDLFKLFPVPDKAKEYYFNCPGLAISTVLLDNVGLYIENFSGIPFTDEENATLIRFGKVFQQTYTRFFDLQKAETQAREAQIELALERVRARSMAMHKSEELVDTSIVLFNELKNIGITAIRTGVATVDSEHEMIEIWSSQFVEQNEIRILGMVPRNIHPFYEGYFESWLRNDPYYICEIAGDDLRKYYLLLSPILSYPAKKEYNPKETFSIFFFPEGSLNVITIEALTEDQCNLLVRFARVFGHIYTRFLDLKRAEAQTLEAIKQSSLDRVRGQIASMRTTKDLERITPIIWHELITLDVPLIRCGVFIVDEEKSNVQVYLTTPEVKPLAVLNLSFDSNELTSQTVDHWRIGKVYREHWNKEQFVKWAQSMLRLGQIQDQETYQGSENPPETLDLHFVPFTQGMLYVGNTHPLSDEKIQLVQSLADAFSIAYARYEDFNKLEKAKASIESTLTELKATQSQLIQSEKMASLGELTAGIAHEIQNPLNFVNNFSEVNTELIEEMQMQMDKGNLVDAKTLLNDIKENEQKINHHGKRADAIVKGMLQHSRSSTGIKEPTNINALADEYLRLAYHGLRAKDKSFNATVKTEFDESIGKINIISQDIGRVILNLISNAFYEVSEKKKHTDNASLPEGKGYEPTVSVTTKRTNDKVLISVKDNGNGIPQKVLEKIFQPFFTTKPAGQGTGLGLSMSYDIIKAHGGELQVETKEGEGAVFTIQLNVE